MTNTITSNNFQKSVGTVNEKEAEQFVFGKKINLVTKLFGCWHTNISRPFVSGKVGYRSCLQCGARKHFNPETLQTDKSFYFPPIGAQPRL